MQKPLALVVVGGMTLAPVLILLVLPVLISRFSTRLPLSQRKKKHDPMVDDQGDTRTSDTISDSGVPA